MKDDWTPERAPLQLGDEVYLVRDLFGIGLHTRGVVVSTDIPVARAYRLGFDSMGIIEVEFGSADRRVQSHWTNFTKTPPPV